MSGRSFSKVSGPNVHNSRPLVGGNMSSKGKTLSNRELSLTMKTVVSRQVRESSNVASAVVAARRGGKSCEERSNRVGQAHGEEKLRAAQMRATRRGVIYGDAVTEANKRGRKKSESKKETSFNPPR